MYRYQDVISSGSYGRVLKIERDGVLHAVKEFFVTARKGRIHGAINLKEVDFLRRCVHPNILTPQAITYGIPYSGNPPHLDKATTDAIYVIMPLAQETLHQFIKDQKGTVPMLKRFMLQISQALAYLHANDICYRDVKSANVLIFQGPDGVPNAVLCDLGMCKPLTHGQINSDHVGTMAYKSPEVMMSTGVYSFPMDVWALGVLFFEMFNVIMPFERQRERGNDKKQNMETSEIIVKLFHNRGSPDIKLFNKLSKGGNTVIAFEKVSRWKMKPISDLFDHDAHHIVHFDDDSDLEVLGPGSDRDDSTPAVKLPNFGTYDEYVALLERILQVDPDARPTMREVLDDPFFAGVPKTDEPEWHGLKHRDSQREGYHILKKTSNDEARKRGLVTFDGFSTNFTASEMMAWRIFFLGLDLYDRCLLAVEELKTEVHEGLLAYSCCYLACKYFLDESTPSIDLIFPKLSYDIRDVIDMECKILIELVDWKIYRPTVYDILKIKPEPETLAKVLMTKPAVYNHRVDRTAEIYAQTLAAKK